MLELRKLYGLSKTKQRERLMGCIVYSPHWLKTTLSHIAKMGELYTYIIRGAFGVARFDNPGNAKALTRGTSDRIGSTFLICVYSIIFIISHIGAYGYFLKLGSL